jgi:cytidylate kinase
MIITIDGPSGTGKSTVAKAVARHLGFTFFDTGAMYRSLAWKILSLGIDPADEEKVVNCLGCFDFEIQTDAKGDRSYFVEGRNVTGLIRSREISTISSQIAAYPGVRKSLVKMQRKFGRSCNAVFEGRDMGTVVFPEADLKVFLTARPTVRAERRYRELLAKFPDLSEPLSIEQVLKEMAERDKNDSDRVLSPLKQAPDAVLIDTSDDSVDQIVAKILRLKARIKKRPPSMKLSYFFVYWLARIYFKIFFRLQVYGVEHLRPGAGLLVANHTSFFDPPVLSVSCPEEVHFLARESLFRIPLLGRLIKMLNTHPVSRDASDLHVLRQMVRLLGEGQKLIMFPEGTRSATGEIQSFERGFSFLAKKAKCTIYPAYIDGAHKSWPMGRKFPRFFGKITCVFGAPIEWEDFEDFPKDEVEKQLAEHCFHAIGSLRSWLRNKEKKTSCG